MINGLGATPLMEQFIFMGDVSERLSLEGVEIEFKKVGSYMTSLDMAGISLTMLKLADTSWLPYLEHPTETPTAF
ncbi:Phosphoenolpyruvate--glycerone phosphotransferase [Lentibacillus sp. JNUCC-1]|nr:Phosphoenolpyruvate--glycerone phosphotransferase [Lentibacillus sp. JNUCC-1]